MNRVKPIGWIWLSQISTTNEWTIFAHISNIGRCQSSATSIFQPPPSCRTTTSSQHARPSGVLRRRSDGLECTAWWPPRPVAQCRQFPENAKKIKFKTYLLTYLRIAAVIVDVCPWTVPTDELCNSMQRTVTVSHLLSCRGKLCSVYFIIFLWQIFWRRRWRPKDFGGAGVPACTRQPDPGAYECSDQSAGRGLIKWLERWSAWVIHGRHWGKMNRSLFVRSYDSVYLTCSTKLTGSQLSLPQPA